MKKIQSFILALTMALTLAFSAVPMGASAASVELPKGFTFYDTAYSPSKGIYLALAKSGTTEKDKIDPTRIYKSTDGLTWSLAKDFSKGYNANRQSRQNLVWWEDGDTFIFAGGDKVYSSADGETWVERNGIARSNATLTTDENYLHVVGGKASKIMTSGNQLTQTVTHHLFTGQNEFPSASGISDKDTNGNRRFMAMTQWLLWTYDETSADGSNFDNVVEKNITGNLTGAPVDLIYDGATEKWIVIDKSSTIFAVGQDSSISKIENANKGNAVTAIGKNQDIVLTGTANGDMYMASTQEGINADTQWTAAIPDGDPMTDEVRSISSTTNGQFLIATATKLYLGEKKGTNFIYKDINECHKLSTPIITVGDNPFAGTQILGGAYSPVLDMYVVYGNTVDAGKIYSSKDGITWKVACDSQVKLNAGSRNAAVWWDKALVEEGKSVGAFVISAADGACWYSKDGVTWSYKQWKQNEVGSIGIEGDIVVAGEYLYTPFDVGQYSRFSNINGENNVTRVKIGDGMPAFRQMAVSDDGQYVFLSTNYGTAKVYNTETKAVVDANDGPSTMADKVVDVKWNQSLGYFVGVHSTDPMVVGMGMVNMQRELTIRPFGSAVPVFTAFDSNGSGYMFGRADGSIYSTNTMDLQGGQPLFTKVSASNGVDNTLKITDVVKGKNGQYLVTASDGTDSDALLVAADGSGYVKASEGAPAAEADLYEGNTATVKVNYVNNSENDVSFKMITAIYNKDNQIIQTVMDDKTMSAGQSAKLTQDVTFKAGIDSDCMMKVMMWNDMDSLRPITDCTPFFQ